MSDTICENSLTKKMRTLLCQDSCVVRGNIAFWNVIDQLWYKWSTSWKLQHGNDSDMFWFHNNYPNYCFETSAKIAERFISIRLVRRTSNYLFGKECFTF